MWIEIFDYIKKDIMDIVAPHAGVWIEIPFIFWFWLVMLVAPHAGVWIEIFIYWLSSLVVSGRSPRGSVD